MGNKTNPRGGFAASMKDPFYWPALHVVDVGMTPAEAWQAWLMGEIDATEFGRVLNAWT